MWSPLVTPQSLLGDSGSEGIWCLWGKFECAHPAASDMVRQDFEQPPKLSRKLANWSLPLSFPPSDLDKVPVLKVSSNSLTSSQSSQSLSPDCLRSNCTPKTLHKVWIPTAYAWKSASPARKTRHLHKSRHASHRCFSPNTEIHRSRLTTWDEGGRTQPSTKRGKLWWKP